MKLFSSAIFQFRLPLLIAAMSILLPFSASAQEVGHTLTESKAAAEPAANPSPVGSGPDAMSKPEFNWENSWNIAVIGAYTLSGTQTHVTPPVSPDFVLIAGIDKDNHELCTELIPVTRTASAKETPDGGAGHPDLSVSFTEGGYEAVLQALTSDLGIRFDDYVFLDWNAIIDAINALNGVEVDISDEEFIYINAFTTEGVAISGRPSRIIKQAGVNYLDGVQLAAYSRLKTSENDPEHVNRQRKALSLVWQKAMEADFQSLYRVFEVMLPLIQTSIDADDMGFLLRYGKNWI